MLDNNPITTLKIDLWSVLKIILVFLLFWFLYLIRDVVFIFLIAFFLSIIITPAVDSFERKKIPRWLGSLSIYLIIFAVIILLGFLLIPSFISQGKILLERIPGYLKDIFGGWLLFEGESFGETLKNWLISSPQRSQLFSLFGNIVGGLFASLMVLVIAFYLSVDKEFINRQIKKFTKLKYQEFLINFYEAIKKSIGGWGRGILILCLIIGLSSYVGLRFLGVKFALTLAVIAGITEIIPYLGPWIGGAAAFVVALVDSPMKALLVAIFYLILQQVENSFLVPLVMKKAVGLNPIIVLAVLLIGDKLAGPLGALLSVPIATIISILLQEYLKYKKLCSSEK